MYSQKKFFVTKKWAKKLFFVPDRPFQLSEILMEHLPLLGRLLPYKQILPLG
jgi:hypothetical protein